MWYFLKIGDPSCHGKKGENEGIKVAVGRQKGSRGRRGTDVGYGVGLKRSAA